MGNRILHISANQFPSLEVDHFTKKIWKELAKGADEYHVLARAKDNRFHHYKEGNLYLHLVPAITKRQWSFFFTSFYMLVIIRKYKCNILLAQCPVMGGFAAALVKRFKDIKFMVELHGEEYFRYFTRKNYLYKVLDFIQRYSFKKANVIRSLSPKMTQKLKNYGIIDKVVLIPNRVDLQLFNKRKTDFAILGKPKLISIGRFVEAKNYEFLIKCCLENNWQLTLIGGGSLRANYEAMIPADKREDIILIDWIPQAELIDLVIHSDIYIQSSISEGMPRTLLEAMAMNMPIVSTNVGSIEGIIIDNENGLLIDDPRSSKEYREVINRLINSEEIRKIVAANGYNWAVNEYEWNKVFEIYRGNLYSTDSLTHE